MDLSLLVGSSSATTLVLMCLPVIGGVLLIAAAFSGGSASGQFKRRIAKVTGTTPTPQEIVQAVVNVRRTTADSKYAFIDQLIKTTLPRPDLLRTRLERAGMKPVLGRYLMFSGVSGILLFVLSKFGMGVPNLVAVLLGVFGAVGLPHFILGRKAAKRQLQFIMHFADAIDLMVRGLKAGLPIAESIKSAGKEIPGPAGEELTRIFEAVKIGTKMDAALWETAARMQIPEFNFFTVALSIQSETGGNLAETLSGLSNVLRQRKTMKLKVKAMSSEAKASAYIIGSLPFIMFLLLFLINSEYVMTLINDPRGNIMLAGGLAMFGIGIGVMYKMVKFEI